MYITYKCTLMIHICTHIYINTGKEIVFMAKSFFFNYKKNSSGQNNFSCTIKEGFTTNFLFLLLSNQL